MEEIKITDVFNPDKRRSVRQYILDFRNNQSDSDKEREQLICEKYKSRYMREQIEDLLEHHRMSSQEVWYLLEESNKINQAGMSKKDKMEFNQGLERLESEYKLRGIFINDLENLLLWLKV